MTRGSPLRRKSLIKIEFKVRVWPRGLAILNRLNSDNIVPLKVSFYIFSAYEKVGQRFQVESRIISSSVQPPPGKLVDPVVIVFGGIQVTGLACPVANK